MIKTYTNIDLNKSMDKNNLPTVGMKVRELASGRKAKVTGVYESDNQVWMVSGNDVGVFNLDSFWDLFEKVKS
jgi:hypothetical protein